MADGGGDVTPTASPPGWDGSSAGHSPAGRSAAAQAHDDADDNWLGATDSAAAALPPRAHLALRLADLVKARLKTLVRPGQHLPVDRVQDQFVHIGLDETSLRRYELVRELRRALGELLSSADKERLLAAPPPPPDELAATAARLAATPAFASLQQTLEAEIEQAVAEALHRLENDEELWPEDGRSSFGSISWARALSLSGGGGGGRDGSQRAAAASAGSGSLRSGRLDDDFGEPFSMFLGPAQQTQRLVARLGRDTALHHRLEAVDELSRMASSELRDNELWPDIQAHLSDALLDDPQLYDGVLKFYVALFRANPSTTKDSYLALAQHMQRLSQTPSGFGRVERSGTLDTSEPAIHHILRQVHLLNEFQHRLPNFWVRFGDRHMGGLVQATLPLLEAPQDVDASALSLANHVALIDPRASWFTLWMNGSFSRVHILDFLHTTPSLVSQLLTTALRCFLVEQPWQTHTAPPLARRTTITQAMLDGPQDQASDYIYTRPQLAYLESMHALCIVVNLLRFRRGRALFPVHVPLDPSSCRGVPGIATGDGSDGSGDAAGVSVSVKGLLAVLLQIMCAPVSAGRPSASTHDDAETEALEADSDDSYFDPRLLASDLVKGIAGSSAETQNLLCDADLIALLMGPLQTLSANKQFNSAGLVPGELREDIVINLADILACLAGSSEGLHLMLHPARRDEGQEGLPTQGATDAPIHVMTGIVLTVLRVCCGDACRGEQLLQSTSIASALLLTCRQLYNTSQGLRIIEKYELHRHIGRALQHALPGVSAEANGFWHDDLVDSLLTFARTPRGVCILLGTGAAQVRECVAFMFERFKKKLQVSKYEKFGYGITVVQIAATAAGMRALDDCGFVSLFASSLLETAELTDKAARSDHCLSSNKAVAYVLRVFSSYEGLRALSSPRVSIFNVLDRLVVLETVEKCQALTEFFDAHETGLRVAMTLCSCLDTFLLLEQHFSLSSVLLQLQTASRRHSDDNSDDSNDDFLIDQPTLLRNRILVGWRRR